VGLPVVGTPYQCFAQPPSALHKRGSISFAIPNAKLVCTWENNYNRPYQDCFNALGMYCQVGSPLLISTADCRQKILTIVGNLNQNWKDYVNKCANWIAGGNYSSFACSNAITAIITTETYRVVLPDGEEFNENISPAFITSVKPLFM
jgi:hypothetical protein